MLQYLVILLDDTSTSYCHYPIFGGRPRLIALDDLYEGILFAMKENLSIQFVYPDFQLPQSYNEAIETIDHVKISPFKSFVDGADIFVFNGIEELLSCELQKYQTGVLRIDKASLFKSIDLITVAINKISRLNVVITDEDTFSDKDFESYQAFLDKLRKSIALLYVEGRSPQVNLITDRLFLNKMNNCNAGDTNITLAPDGRFYPCPAYYYEYPESIVMGLGGPPESPFSIGNLKDGLDIKNPQLYKIEHAPLCRICDAYQCKRCSWLNWKLTREVNTPSHEQCVISHLERNTTQELLNDLRGHGFLFPDIEIRTIDYLDPFEVKEEW